MPFPYIPARTTGGHRGSVARTLALAFLVAVVLVAVAVTIGALIAGDLP